LGGEPRKNAGFSLLVERSEKKIASLTNFVPLCLPCNQTPVTFDGFFV